MLGLWIRLAEGFGHRFTSSAGDEPNQTWTDSLASLSHEQFRVGLDRLAASTEAWPPSLGEFRGWCIGAIDEKRARVLAEQEWESRPPIPYNPFNPGPSYQELERERRQFVNLRVQQLTKPDSPIAIEQQDHRRICQDEEYL